jgi:hypothetical protein
MLDSIERYFGVAPDNGGGEIEFLFYVVMIILIVAITLHLNITKNGPS